MATQAGIDYAASYGFSLHIPDQDLNLWDHAYIYNAALEANPQIGIRSRTVNFSTVRANIPKIPELQAAADDLVKQAVNWLLERQNARTFYDVDGVISAIPLRPGDRIELVYTDPSGDWSISRTGSNALYMLEVTQSYDGRGVDQLSGLQMYTLRLSDGPWAQPTVEGTEASLSRDVERFGRISGGAMSQISISVGSLVTGSGGSSPSDHGALAGLSDDDHPQYWNVTRGNAAIATHAAIPAAHHAPVTAGTAIALTGQQVHVNLSGVGAIVDSSGLLLNLAASSGLEIVSNALKMRTPLTVSTTSTNSLVSGPSHAADWTDNANVNFNKLLGVGATGVLGVRRLAVGENTSAPILASTTALIQAGAASHVALRLRGYSSQTADILSVSSITDNPYVAITKDGTLESRGEHGFVTGIAGSGWQLRPDGTAELLNVFVRGELHATVFVADEMHATGGTLWVGTASNIAQAANATDNTLPALGSSFVLNLAASWIGSGLSYFAVGDVLRIRSMGDTSAGGPLNI